jgi:hypothetical protein
MSRKSFTMLILGSKSLNAPRLCAECSPYLQNHANPLCIQTRTLGALLNLWNNIILNISILIDCIESFSCTIFRCASNDTRKGFVADFVRGREPFSGFCSALKRRAAVSNALASSHKLGRPVGLADPLGPGVFVADFVPGRAPFLVDIALAPSRGETHKPVPSNIHFHRAIFAAIQNLVGEVRLVDHCQAFAARGYVCGKGLAHIHHISCTALGG